MGILGYISGLVKKTFNTVMGIKKTIQVFKISYKTLWDKEYSATHDIHQEIENISQKKIDYEHRDKFSLIRNQLIDDWDLDWEQSGKKAHDIMVKPDADLTDYEKDLKAEYDTP